jgi:hypothetical protein
MVPYSKRGEGKFETLDKARQLASHTIHLCSNEKNFPKRYRWCITGKIVDSSITICNYIEMANSVFVETHEDYVLRRQLQTKALAETYALYSMIEISKITFGLECGKAANWAKMVTDLQEMIRNWKKKDKKV